MANVLISDLTANPSPVLTDLHEVETAGGTSYKQTMAQTQALLNSNLLHVEDQKASETSGGTFTSGSWQTRVLNTSVTNEITGSSIASNQITLPAGSYYIEAHAPGYNIGYHAVRLQNVTDALTVLSGTSEYTPAAAPTTTRSFLTGKFTLVESKVLEIQHSCGTTKENNGLGLATNFTVSNETYSVVKIWKV